MNLGTHLKKKKKIMIISSKKKKKKNIRTRSHSRVTRAARSRHHAHAPLAALACMADVDGHAHGRHGET